MLRLPYVNDLSWPNFLSPYEKIEQADKWFISIKKCFENLQRQIQFFQFLSI